MEELIPTLQGGELGGEVKVLACQNLIKDLTLQLGAALVSHWSVKPNSFSEVRGMQMYPDMSEKKKGINTWKMQRKSPQET